MWSVFKILWGPYYLDPSAKTTVFTVESVRASKCIKNKIGPGTAGSAPPKNKITQQHSPPGHRKVGGGGLLGNHPNIKSTKINATFFIVDFILRR